VVAVEPPRPGAAVVAVVPLESVEPLAPFESVEPLVAVVELAPEPPPGPDPELEPEPDIVDDVAPIDDVVVVALAGPLAPVGVDGSAARTGEIATSPTTPTASGNRNRRCMPAS
jgi:hypothetical protein